MEQVYTWVKNIVAFLLLVILIDQILPSSNYKKYIKVSVGLVMILLVFTPVLNLLNKGDSMDYYFNLENFKISSSDLNYDSEMAGAQKNEFIVSQYKETLIEQMKELVSGEDYQVKSIDVEIEEDYDSEDFGRINSISITLTHTETTDETFTNIEINEITFEETGTSSESEASLSDNKKNEISLELKNTLTGYYGVDMNNISILFK